LPIALIRETSSGWQVPDEFFAKLNETAKTIWRLHVVWTNGSLEGLMT
jgi:hypothetical protein